jgi:hypothetical protein
MYTLYLGYFSSCLDDVEHARRIYLIVADLCKGCCKPELTIR